MEKPPIWTIALVLALEALVLALSFLPILGP